MATEKEIAARCNVSIGTVDRVLHNRGRVNEQTRQKVLEMAKALNYTPNRVAQGLAVRKKKLHFVFFCLAHEEHPFYRDVNQAAWDKAQELMEYGVKVSFVPLRTEITDGKIQLIAPLPEGESVDGVAMIGAARIEGDLAEGTPVVYYNTEPSDGGGFAFVGCDYVRAGKIAAGLCAACADEEKQIAIFSEGGMGRDVCSFYRRIESFREHLAQVYPQCRIVGGHAFSNRYEEDYEAIRGFLHEHPGVSAVYVVNPGNYDICGIIRELDPSGNIRVITNDMPQPQKQMLREGIISAAITQAPEMQGAMPLELLFQYLAYGKTPENRVFYTELKVRLADNLN